MIQRFKKLSKVKKILLAAIALVLCAVIAFGLLTYRQRSRYFCQYAKPFSFSEAGSSEEVSLIAHRGLSVLAPENTLPAYEKAAEQGFDYVETDIRCTADGVWILSHDASLKRMTGFKGTVEEMTLSEVQAHPITKGGHIEEYAPLYTPTYEEFLALCLEKELMPVIEVKTSAAKVPDAPFQSIIHLVKRYGLEKDAMIISFDYEVLQILREYDADIRMQLLVKKLDDGAFLKADKLGNCGIDCAFQSLLKAPDKIESAKRSGIALNAWTVDKLKSCAKRG